MPGVIFSAEEYFKFQKRKIVRIEDYEAIRDSCTECGEVGVALDRYDQRGLSTATPAPIPTCAALPGRWFRSTTWTLRWAAALPPPTTITATHNVIVGYDIVDNLLGEGDPIGKEIRVDGIPYTIVGVGDRQGKTLGQSQDNWVAVPITTYQQTYGYNDSLDIYARASGNAESMERAEDEVRVLMRARRHNAAGTARRLRDRDQRHLPGHLEADLCDLLRRGDRHRLHLAGGGRHRDHEHHAGHRSPSAPARSACARRWAPGSATCCCNFSSKARPWRWWAEPSACCAGSIVAKLITLVVGFPTSVQLWSVLLGLFMAGATGVFFGVYPASKAAKLDPVVALRAEL